MDRLLKLAALVMCMMVSILAGARLWGGNQTAPQQAGPPIQKIDAGTMQVSTVGIPREGKETARLAIVEFSDFECPFCGRHARTTYPDIKERIVETGAAVYAYRHLPLRGKHPAAAGAAAAAACAEVQGRFWSMHDVLFKNQGALGAPALAQYAANLGLDAGKFSGCVDTRGPIAVSRDEEEAQRLGIKATPTFLIGILDAAGVVDVRRRVSGAAPIQVFENALTELKHDL